MEPIKNRYDFVYLFDVADGNPNGDPDAGNLPRVDPEDGRGLVTDVCLKRKVRNWILANGKKRNGKDEADFKIFVTEKAVLNSLIKEAYDVGKAKDEDDAQQWLCREYYDIRSFGAVLTTGAKGDKKAGQVLGPVQLTFGRSIDRIIPAEHSITRMAVTREEDREKERTMGRKATIPYGLYRAHGFVNVPPAVKTGFSGDDLKLFWDALKNMFDLDRSAARGLMAARALIVFKHESPLGNAPATGLFERVKVERNGGEGPPRSFADYKVNIEEKGLPSGVTLERLL